MAETIFEGLPAWALFFLQSGAASALGLFVLWLFRETIGKYFSGRIDLSNARELEGLKSDLRRMERLIDVEVGEHSAERAFYRSEIAAAQRERNTALQGKMIDAAEELAESFAYLARMYMLIEFLKQIDVDKLIAKAGMPKAMALFQTLCESVKVDEWARERPYAGTKNYIRRVFLPSEVADYAEAHEAIVYHASGIAQVIAVGIDPKDAFEFRSLQEKLEKALPEAKDGFDRCGYVFAFYCLETCRERALQKLRGHLWGSESDAAMRTSVEFALTATNTSDAMKARRELSSIGFPSEVLREAPKPPRPM